MSMVVAAIMERGDFPAHYPPLTLSQTVRFRTAWAAPLTKDSFFCLQILTMSMVVAAIVGLCAWTFPACERSFQRKFSCS